MKLTNRLSTGLCTLLLGWAFVGSVSAAESALPEELVSRLVSVVDQDRERLVTIFKDLHQNPELGMMETRTAGIVARELKALGFEVTTGIGVTGVVGVLKNGDGPTVMYRADMDANAVKEETGLPYASTRRMTREDGEEVPVAHMCGHDAHTTWLIAVAKVMVALKDSWNGTLVLLAQPAEETLSGAKAMVNDGLYSRHDIPEPDYLLALHTAPFPTGTIITNPTTLMAGTEQLDVTFYGEGGHGSAPHWAKDPVVMAAMAIVQYQSIVSRIVDPSEPAVLTVGSIHGGLAANIIPDSVQLKINLRFFDNEVHRQLNEGIASINDSVARSYGMPEDRLPEMASRSHSTPLVNSPALVERVAGVLSTTEGIGVDQVLAEFPPITGSEDAHLLVDTVEEAQVAFLFIGIADPKVFAQARAEGKQIPYSTHSPFYKVELEAIPVGAKVAASSLLKLMGNN